MIKIPQQVKKEAQEGYLLHTNGFVGGTDTGYERDHQLINSKEISIQDLRVMRNWFARHRITSYPGYLKWVSDNKPEIVDRNKNNYRGAVAWLLWGGTPAYEWINSNEVQEALNREYPDKENKLPNL